MSVDWLAHLGLHVEHVHGSAPAYWERHGLNRRTIDIQAGQHTISAADPLPADPPTPATR